VCRVYLHFIWPIHNFVLCSVNTVVNWKMGSTTIMQEQPQLGVGTHLHAIWFSEQLIL
jgi:hypothetical protein